ncbi:MAG: hypothetical protein ACXWYO_07610 [Gaiellaceae bacterium]
MKKLATFAVLCAALLSFGAGAQGASAPLPPYAGQCGLPATQPLWAEFGWPTPAYEAIFGKPGIVVGASSGAWPAKMRDAGAATVYFDLNLKNRIGTTTKPADPALIDGRAKTFFDYTVQQTGCATPVIVLNELAGAGLVTPWSDNNAQYRQNALRFVQLLAGFGAHPVMLIAARPYTGGDALVWWQQMAAAAEIVRESYVPATATWKSGPVLGNRTLRESYRRAVGDLTSIGIAPNRVGLMLSFASSKGFGGRSGLQPDSAWYEVAKWQSLAAQQVAAETGIASVWSWGWGQWTAPEQDPAKAYALCAWLWTRSPALCNAPKAIGAGFDPARTTGQLSALTPGEQCVVGKQVLLNDAIQRLQLVTGERDTAYSALYERIVESGRVPVPGSEVLAAERAVIAQEFEGGRGAYLAALRQAHASVEIARGVLGDQLRRAKLEGTLDANNPSASEVRTFYASYPDLLVRLVQAKPAPGWLGGKPKGLALAEVAPNRLFDLATGRSVVVRTSDGSFTVKALADALPLGAVPLGQAKPTIAAALRAFARGAAFERWSVSQQRFALNDAICARDDLPQPAAVDLTSYLPFLRLG